jgi:hypothetical protein
VPILETVGIRSGWKIALIAALGGALVTAGLLRRPRPRTPVRPERLAAELETLERGIADLRAALDAEPDPLRQLLDAWAAEMEKLAEHADRIAEEAYLATGSGDVLRRLRVDDRDLSELASVIRCRRKEA